MRTKKRTNNRLVQKRKNSKSPAQAKEKRVLGGNISARARRKKSKPATGGFTAPSLLGFKVPSLNAFKIDSTKIFEDECTEAHELDLQLAIPVLYKCLKQHTDFADDKQWEEVPTPAEFMTYLVSEVKKLSKGKSFYFGKLQSESYGLVIYKDYSKYCNMHRLSLEWLLDLKKQNHDMYLTAMCMLSKIAEATQMEVIYTRFNDYFFDCLDAHLIGEDSDRLIVEDVTAYKFRGNGHVYKFHQEFIEAKKLFSIQELQRRIESIRLQSDKQIRFSAWMESGIEVLAKPIQIDRLTTSICVNHNDGEPINAYQMFGMVYSFFDSAFDYEEQYINEHESQFGAEGPFLEEIYLENKKQITPDAEQRLDKLVQFCSHGSEFFDRYYRDNLRKKYEKRQRQIEIEC